jgi:hypothetical protein
MTKTRLQVLALALTLTAVGSAAGVAAVTRDSDAAARAEIAGYTQWARMTSRPVPVEFASVGG